MWLDLIEHLNYLHQINSETRGIHSRLDRIDTKLEDDKLWVKPKKKWLRTRSA